MSQQLPDKLFQSYLSALLAGDTRSCRTVVEDLLAAGTPVKVVYEELFGASMYRVGELWEGGKVSVATEHLATATTESLMSLVYPILFEAPHAGRTAKAEPLDLPVACRVVQGMGGELNVESKPNEGTSFHVDLPC